MEDRCLDVFVSNNKEEACRLLNDVKDRREVEGSGGWTLLHYAAANGWTDIVELLITEYKFDVNGGDVINSSPVYYVSASGQLDVINCLYNTGKCDLFIKNKYSSTPFGIAHQFGREEIVDFITDDHININV